MNLNNFAAEPALIKLSITDPAMLTKYETDSIDFWIYDRQDMTTYMRLASMSGKDNSIGELNELIRGMIFNADGTPILTGRQMLPIDMQLKVIEMTVQYLGNSESRTTASQDPK